MIGFLIEHFAGNFPVWLSPDQVRVIPITDAHNDYAVRLASQMKEQGIRAEADLSNDRMNAKIRQAQLFKIPYMLVVGDREMSEGTVSLRKRDGTRADGMSVDAFIRLAHDRIEKRSRDL
jgi:threonyl-tRNA synthetase